MYVFMKNISNQLFQVLMEEDEYVGVPTFINFQKVWKVNQLFIACV